MNTKDLQSLPVTRQDIRLQSRKPDLLAPTLREVQRVVRPVDAGSGKIRSATICGIAPESSRPSKQGPGSYSQVLIRKGGKK